MKKIENHCVGCPTCINCGLKRVEVCYCDKCKDEIAEYDDGEQELCESCLLEKHKKE